MPLLEIRKGMDVSAHAEERAREEYDAAVGGGYNGSETAPSLTADRVELLLGKARARELREIALPLTTWAVEQPDSVVRELHRKHGRGERGFDGVVASIAARLDREYANHAVEHDAADHAAVHEEAMTKVDRQRVALRGHGKHPTRWMHDPETIKAVAFHDAFEIQRMEKIKREIELGLKGPYVESQLGPMPGRRSAERTRYEELGRRLLEHGCAHRSAVREGLPPPEQTGLERQTLASEVAEFQKQHDVQVAQAVTLRSAGGPGMDMA
jgi:hypothetical protein